MCTKFCSTWEYGLHVCGEMAINDHPLPPVAKATPLLVCIAIISECVKLVIVSIHSLSYWTIHINS